jgi:hypothetical protein
MRKAKLVNEEIKSAPQMKVINTEQDRGHVEFEIDRHVKSIHSLIARLVPTDRQKYYDGLLCHLLSEPIEVPLAMHTPATTRKEHDYSNLNESDLALIRELSQQMEYLYRATVNDNE